MSNEEICQGNTSHKTDSVMLLFIGLVFVFFEASASSYCTPLKSQPTVATSPSMTINTVEFPDENVLPIGYNVTIVCTSNASRENFGVNFFGQPYWIQFYFKEEQYSIKECGGRDGDVDSEDSKVCKYSILNPTKNDSANYSCWSHNQVTCTEGKISLEFKEPLPPKFSVDLPKQLNVSTGSKANLTCQASGIPRPVITWFKNGQRLTSSSIKGVKSFLKLIFDSVSINDQGEYWCEANSLLGWNRSSTTALTVHWKPIFKIHPQNITGYLKDGVITVTLECAADGFPRPVISWVENSSRVINKSVIQNGSVSSLVFVFRESKKTPKYQCMASNSLGIVFSKEATLTILERPTKSAPKISSTKDMTTDRLTDEMSFYRHPESVTAFSGDQVVFMCAVTCSSVINITWLKDGMINDDGKVESFLGKENVSSVLTINSVKDENHGNYSCLAANTIGRTTSKVAVLFITGDTSKSAGVSKIIWIVPVVTAAVVTVLVILIFALHKKFRGADLEHNQEVKELQRFPTPSRA